MPDKPNILIVEDEHDLADLIRFNLEASGHHTTVANDGKQALDLLEKTVPSLLVLDVMLPHFTGLEIAQRVRADNRLHRVPILMLTAKGADEDQVAGLRAGADDYVSKPFSMPVLAARIQALLRRTTDATPEPPSDDTVIALGPVRVDSQTHEATVDGRPLKLTLTEFRLLACLVGAQGKVMSRSDLIVSAIGPGITVTERTIDVHVASIRKKLTPYNDIILTVRGVGYRMIAPN